MNQTIFILVIATLCIIATNFSSNTVCATVFYTISAPIALAMGNINSGSPGLRHRSRGLPTLSPLPPAPCPWPWWPAPAGWT